MVRILAIFTAIALVFTVLFLKNNNTPSVKINTENHAYSFLNLSICQKNELKKCLDSQIEKIRFPLNTYSLRFLYEDISYLKRVNYLSTRDCHLLSHKIGEKMFSSSGDYSEMLGLDLYSENINLDCVNGFHHGVLIGYSKKHKNNYAGFLKKVVEDTEEKFGGGKNNYMYRVVFHGLGHSIFINSENETKALKVCESISRNNASKELCFTGIFMEESFQANDVGINFNLNYCDTLSPVYIGPCFRSIRYPSEFLSQNIDSYSKICNNQNDHLNQTNCIRGFIYNTVRSNLEPEVAYEFCKSINVYEEKLFCLVNYPKRYLIENKSSELGQILQKTCNTLDLKERIICRKDLFTNTYDQNEINNEVFGGESYKLKISDLGFLFKQP